MKKILSVLLLALLLANSVLVIPAGAATNSFVKTDNICQNMINAALANLNKKNADFNGMPQNEWCSYFIDWLSMVSGAGNAGLLPNTYSGYGTTGSIAQYVIKRKTGVFTSYWNTAYNYLVSQCGSSNLIQKGSSSTYTPRPGDLIFFHWKNASSSLQFASHVALVYDVSNTNLSYVDGNGTGTGGFTKTYVSTHKIALDSNEISGFIRLNTAGGVNPTPVASFSPATDPAYTGKAFIAETNAVVVTQVNKNSGTSVTQMGLYLYDANGQLIKKFMQPTTNVSNSLTKYHTWFDMNDEVGLKLTPGTTYRYQFFGIFDGKEIKGNTYSFTTKGTAPLPPTVTYTVTFYPCGGTVSETSRKVKPDSAVGTLPIPTRQGYVFDGWYTAAAGGSKISSSSLVKGNATLYAHWTQAKVFFTVTFDPGVGMVSETSRRVESGSAVGTLPTPTRQGYVFDGWYTAAAGGSKISSSSLVKGDATLYAHWTQAKVFFTVTFDPCGGTVSETSRTVESGSTVGTMPVSTRQGYTFDGWYNQPQAGSKISSNVIIRANATVYAHWTQEKAVAVTLKNMGSGVTNINPDGGKLDAVLTVPAGKKWTACTVSIYTTGGTLIKTHSQTGNATTAGEDYPITVDLSILSSGTVTDGTIIDYGDFQLTAGTIYEVEATAVVDGKTYRSARARFRLTTASTPSSGFTDVAPGVFYYEPVQWAVENGITSGTSATAFSPNNPCDRRQIVTFLWRANGSPEPASLSNPFVDVKSRDYFYKAVLWAREKGITSGTDATHFSPSMPCTRGQAVTFLWRANDKPSGTGKSFSDVKSGDFYADAVKWATGKSITSGTSSTTFSPGQPCTRGQIVTFLYRNKK